MASESAYSENWKNGQLYRRGIRVRGLRYGYWRYYSLDGSVFKDYTGYYLDGDCVSVDNEDGYCLIWNREVVV